MTVSFREIADTIDDFDKDVADINEGRKKFWGEVREHLPARDVKALKLAIKARRKRKADKDGEEAFDARVYEILTEIERGTDHALAHARRAKDLPAHDDIPPHDEDGVLIEDDRPLPSAGGAGESTDLTVRHPEGRATSTISNETAPVSGDAGESPCAEAIKSADASGVLDASPNLSDDPGPIPDFLRRCA